jgi:hypothetical protein
MRLWKPPHTDLNHNSDVSFCLFCLMSWCLSWRSWCAAALNPLVTTVGLKEVTIYCVHEVADISEEDCSRRVGVCPALLQTCAAFPFCPELPAGQRQESREFRISLSPAAPNPLRNHTTDFSLHANYIAQSVSCFVHVCWCNSVSRFAQSAQLAFHTNRCVMYL